MLFLLAYIFSSITIQCTGLTQRNSVGEKLETGFSNLKHLPQYKYIARPVYKAMGGSEKPLVSVPASFITTDVIMHRLLPYTSVNAAFIAGFKETRIEFSSKPKSFIKNALKEALKCRFGNIFSVSWALLSIPVALHKFDKLNR